MLRFFCLLYSTLLILSSLTVSAAARSEDTLFPAYTYEGILTEDTAGIAKGTRVRIYEGESGKHYVIGGRMGGGRVRVPWESVLPYAVAAQSVPAVTKECIISYVGEHLGSKTDFLLWVDLTRTRLYVLEYADEGWQLIKNLPCSVGDAAHPTPSGRFEVSYKSVSIGKENLYLCRYALCFYGGYMLHSVLFDWGGTSVIDGRLSMRISHGCIRLDYAESKWLYENIPIGTTVFIR